MCVSQKRSSRYAHASIWIVDFQKNTSSGAYLSGWISLGRFFVFIQYAQMELISFTKIWFPLFISANFWGLLVDGNNFTAILIGKNWLGREKIYDNKTYLQFNVFTNLINVCVSSFKQVDAWIKNPWKLIM